MRTRASQDGFLPSIADMKRALGAAGVPVSGMDKKDLIEEFDKLPSSLQRAARTSAFEEAAAERAAVAAEVAALDAPSPSVDYLVQVLQPTAIEGRNFGEGCGYHPVYDFAAAAVVLRQVSKWLDAGAYDVVIGERHREVLFPPLLDQNIIDQQKHAYDKTGKPKPGRYPMSGKESLLYEYLKECPEGPEVDDIVGLLMEILSREQDASYIEANGLNKMAYSIVFGHQKLSDECARRGVYKLRKNATLWALLVETNRKTCDSSSFVDSLKVLDPSLA
jgi:hypothetical protein